MANLVKWITGKAEGLQIEAVVIGESPWSMKSDPVPEEKKGKILSWDEAKSMLDYEFDSGYGSAGCHAITAWTKDKVIFVHEYDGSTCIESLPRNPKEFNPYYS
jgi:hypothetical protein